ncbi:MAG: mevalonate kinase [Gammaproteobacteria bacterium]|nr:mevalonate kinase [Gammaproteobacteria bacterium]
MIKKIFQTSINGKWILAGEHAVIRGAPAILFPLPRFKLALSYKHSSTPWQLRLAGNLTDDYAAPLQQVIAHGFELINKPFPTQGTLLLENNIPVSAGLGASAALCTALSEWFAHSHWIHPSELIEFARQLENLFHGESSGADIAVTATNHPIYFVRNQTIEPFTPHWQPNWYLSHCGQASSTADCLKTVSALWKTNPHHAKTIDDIMKNSVSLAKHALGLDASSGLPLLKEAIEQACQAFSQWKLIPVTLNTHLEDLMKAGALAVKPTGSGNGGYVLSLWPSHTPPSRQDLIGL